MKIVSKQESKDTEYRKGKKDKNPAKAGDSQQGVLDTMKPKDEGVFKPSIDLLSNPEVDLKYKKPKKK